MNEIQPWFFIFLMLAVGFYCGYGWGQYSAEKEIRQRRENLEANRVFVSVPAEDKSASEMFRLIGELIEKIQREENDNRP